jgi:6-phosphogluconolactonase
VARISVVDADALADTSAERLTALIESAIEERDVARVALTGGTTPRATYEALADRSRPWRHRLAWSRVQLFWGDERHVRPDHPDSNFGMADRAFVQQVPIPQGQVHRMRGELADPHQAAAEYARELPDQFDVMLLGLGEDCHIASIFPGSPLLDSGSWREPWQSRADEADKPRPTAETATVAALLTGKGWRITLTPPVILSSRAIVVLVSGTNKARAVTTAIDGPLDVVQYPGQILRHAGDRVEWLLDTAAASGLGESGT